jgi:hypothetical protein
MYRFLVCRQVWGLNWTEVRLIEIQVRNKPTLIAQYNKLMQKCNNYHQKTTDWSFCCIRATFPWPRFMAFIAAISRAELKTDLLVLRWNCRAMFNGSCQLLFWLNLWNQLNSYVAWRRRSGESTMTSTVWWVRGGIGSPGCLDPVTYDFFTRPPPRASAYLQQRNPSRAGVWWDCTSGQLYCWREFTTVINSGNWT